MARLLILKTGSTYPDIQQRFGDFDRWFLQQLATDEVTVCDVTCESIPPTPSAWQGIVVTGSPAMVTEREAWSERAAAWLRKAVEDRTPVLGVCYGHQLLAHAFGGRVGFRDRGRESGTFEVRLTHEGRRDSLLGQLPPVFPAHLTHAQSVLALPSQAVLLAGSEGEPHQAFRIGRHAWGVQFHPEFTDQVMAAYLETQAPDLRAEGQDPRQLQSAVRPTPEATGLLARFAGYVQTGEHD